MARTKNAYIAGLVPLFPTFTLIAHYLVGGQQGTAALKQTIRFGLWSLIPYVAYLGALYVLVDRCKLGIALSAAVLCWVVAAVILLLIWNHA